MVLLDTSASWASYTSGTSKARLCSVYGASLVYLATLKQRDAAGLIVFDDEVKDYVRPSTRQGQLPRLLHAIEKRSRRAHRLRKAVDAFSKVPDRRGNRDRDFGFLRGPGDDCAKQ